MARCAPGGRDLAAARQRPPPLILRPALRAVRGHEVQRLIRCARAGREVHGLPYRRMAGLTELFRTKLGARAPGRALDAPAVIHVSVRHSWRWERPHASASKLRWRAWGEEECRRVRITLRGQQIPGVHARFRGADPAARWGALQDPLKRLQLAVCWPKGRCRASAST